MPPLRNQIPKTTRGVPFGQDTGVDIIDFAVLWFHMADIDGIDQVLAGSTVDTNSPWLCKLLHNRGIDMVRMEFVGDNAKVSSLPSFPSPFSRSLFDVSKANNPPSLPSRSPSLQDIQDSILRMKEAVGPNGIIFTSGGIGPTHDDVTYDAIAGAFG